MHSKQYQKSGVNIEAGYEAVKRIKKHIEKTRIKGMLGGIGGFGGMFDISGLGYKEPVLVSGTDGVGTKLLLAILINKHDTIGQDLVAMCVNDIIVQGAKPLFFLDYIAIGKNDPKKIEVIVGGIAKGCVEAGCALIGGETAEMPDVYKNDHYDLAGYGTGIVEKFNIVDAKRVENHDVIIGLASSGVHSNGYSLVRKIILKDNKVSLNKYYKELNDSVGNALMVPTKIYVKPTLGVLDKVKVKSIAHITGGGFYENIPRSLPEHLGAIIDVGSFKILPIFNLLQKMGKVSDEEMFNVFNMGIGMTYVVAPKDVEKTLQILERHGQVAYVIGKVCHKKGVHLK